MDKRIKHGMEKTRFYRIWVELRRRCYAYNRPSYKYYGDKGITFCDTWSDFNNFKNDMYTSYLGHINEHNEKNTTLDRKENNKGYYKDNCKWSTYREQIMNRTNQEWFVAFSPNKEMYWCRNQLCFANKFNLERTCINDCLKDNIFHHKFWTFKKVTDIGDIKDIELSNTYKAVSPHNEIYYFKNIREFCREHELDNSSVSKCIIKVKKHYKNWIFNII